jgi:hypothetical protein
LNDIIERKKKSKDIKKNTKGQKKAVTYRPEWPITPMHLKKS